MPKTICAIVPGPGGYPSFMGFRATQYTYPPAPISPDPESTRQLQQLLNRGASAGGVSAPGAMTGTGLAEEATSGGATSLTGSSGWETEEPMIRSSVSAVGTFPRTDVEDVPGNRALARCTGSSPRAAGKCSSCLPRRRKKTEVDCYTGVLWRKPWP